jgi:uncharacterized protein (DUF1501 family)
MNRRGFLKLAAGIAPLTLVAPGVFAAEPLRRLNGASALPHWDRVLLLIELKGGNDGLNTVIPYRDEVYRQLRPRLGVPVDQVLQLDDKLGLHPSLAGLMPLWKAGKLGVTLGVGYPNPNRSHFRSIEIWETGSDSNQYLSEGWLARLFEKERPPATFAADGVVIGDGDIGPLSGGARTLAMNNPDQFLKQAANVNAPQARTGNAALAHILEVRQDLKHAVSEMRTQVQNGPATTATFPGTAFGRQIETASKLIVSKVPLAVIKISLGGFDTHSNQAGTQQRLLKELADGLAAFQKAMEQTGNWDRVLAMTYSEFGRRVKENASQGTDHGTAAPHFILGGRVKGGLYGEQPSLANLDNGDLKFTLDYRDLYATAAEAWWGLPAGSQGGTEHKPLNCIA